MSKTLLRITSIKGSVCETEVGFDTPLDRKTTAAALLSLMDRDEAFASEMLRTVVAFCTQRDNVAEMNRQAMRLGKAKIKN